MGEEKSETENEEIKIIVRKGYARIAKEESPCCGSVDTCSCTDTYGTISKQMGYTDEELKEIPEGADLGLGCGNPVALASLREGEVVLDLGSGAGLDCFLAAKKVGERGRVIGVDMTPEMIDKARENARSGNYGNVEFRLGEIENLPLADNLVDVVISNCVINLSPNKRRVFDEAFRVLKRGGRLMVSDIVLLKKLPDAIRNSVEAYVGCLSGAMLREKYIDTIRAAGFNSVKIVDETSFSLDCMINDPTAQSIMDKSGITPDETRELGKTVLSIKVHGVKAKATS